MNTLSKIMTINQSVDFSGYVKNWKQAKITGMLSIGCAIVAVLLSIVPVLTVYFPFLLLSAALALFGFQEVCCDRNKKLNLVISIISLSLLMVLFIITFGIAFSSYSETILIQFWIFYGFLSTIIPIFLSISALISNNTEKWKSLMPSAVPVFYAFSSAMANSNSSKTALLLLPLGWGLLGIVACIGNAARNSNEEAI